MNYRIIYIYKQYREYCFLHYGNIIGTTLFSDREGKFTLKKARNLIMHSKQLYVGKFKIEPYENNT
jgi:hypothetical protein